MASNDQEIFDHATTDQPLEQTENVAVEPTEAPAEAQPERARDEKGRFASADPEPTAEVATETPKVEDGGIPSWRLKEEADARREWQQKAETAEREAREFRTQMAALQRQMQEQNAPKPEPVDIFADPNAYQAHVQQTLDTKIRNMEANFSLRLAHSQHGEVFEKAYQDAEARALRGDTSIMQAVANSPDPGQYLVNWYKREQVISQVGDDPQAYVNKKLEEALSDPAFLAKALEKAKVAAGAQPNNQIDIPPSLSKATAAARASEGSDHTDRGVYAYATEKRR